jgi:hypothetical protein
MSADKLNEIYEELGNKLKEQIEIIYKENLSLKEEIKKKEHNIDQLATLNIHHENEIKRLKHCLEEKQIAIDSWFKKAEEEHDKFDKAFKNYL